MPGLVFIATSALVAAGSLVWLGAELRGSGAGRRACARCRYEMSGTTDLQCPECGHIHASDAALTRAHRSRRRIAAAGAGIVLGLAGAASPVYLSPNPWGLVPTRVLLWLWPMSVGSRGPLDGAAPELTSRPLTPAQAEALVDHILTTWNDPTFDVMDDEAEETALALVMGDDGLVRTEWKRPEPEAGFVNEESDDSHYFASLGLDGAVFVPRLAQAARNIRHRSSAPTTILSLMSRDCPEACDALIDLFDASVGADDAFVARAGRLGVSRLLASLADERRAPASILVGIDVLRRMEADDPGAVAALSPLLFGANEEARNAVSAYFGSIDPKREAVLPLRDRLVDAVTSKARVDLFTFEPLIAVLEPEDLAQAAPLLESRDADLRARAVALFSMTATPPQLTEYLVGALDAASDPGRACCYEAALRLAITDPRITERAKADLVAGAANAENARHIVERALEPEELVAFWITLLDHQRWETRELACDALAKTGSHEALERLRAMRSDPDQWVAKAAARAVRSLTRSGPPSLTESMRDEIDLARRAGQPVLPLFPKYLNSIDPQAHATAVAFLSEIVAAGEQLKPDLLLTSKVPNDIASAIIVRAVELDQHTAAADIIAWLLLRPWIPDRGPAVSDAIARLAPEQAATLRDALVARLRGTTPATSTTEAVQALDAIASSTP
jgi:hypothetical protein